MSPSQAVLHFLSCCSSHTEGPVYIAIYAAILGAILSDGGTHIAPQNIPLLVYSFTCIGRRRSQRKLQM